MKNLPIFDGLGSLSRSKNSVLFENMLYYAIHVND